MTTAAGAAPDLGFEATRISDDGLALAEGDERRLAFSGLVVRGDLQMTAVASTDGVGRAAVRFLAAGSDLALVCRSAEARRGAAVAKHRALAQEVSRDWAASG